MFHLYTSSKKIAIPSDSSTIGSSSSTNLIIAKPSVLPVHLTVYPEKKQLIAHGNDVSIISGDRIAHDNDTGNTGSGILRDSTVISVQPNLLYTFNYTDTIQLKNIQFRISPEPENSANNNAYNNAAQKRSEPVKFLSEEVKNGEFVPKKSVEVNGTKGAIKGEDLLINEKCLETVKETVPLDSSGDEIRDINNVKFVKRHVPAVNNDSSSIMRESEAGRIYRNESPVPRKSFKASTSTKYNSKSPVSANSELAPINEVDVLNVIKIDTPQSKKPDSADMQESSYPLMDYTCADKKYEKTEPSDLEYVKEMVYKSTTIYEGLNTPPLRNIQYYDSDNNELYDKELYTLQTDSTIHGHEKSRDNTKNNISLPGFGSLDKTDVYSPPAINDVVCNNTMCNKYNSPDTLKDIIKEEVVDDLMYDFKSDIKDEVKDEIEDEIKRNIKDEVKDEIEQTLNERVNEVEQRLQEELEMRVDHKILQGSVGNLVQNIGGEVVKEEESGNSMNSGKKRKAMADKRKKSKAEEEEDRKEVVKKRGRQRVVAVMMDEQDGSKESENRKNVPSAKGTVNDSASDINILDGASNEKETASASASVSDGASGSASGSASDIKMLGATKSSKKVANEKVKNVASKKGRNSKVLQEQISDEQKENLEDTKSKRKSATQKISKSSQSTENSEIEEPKKKGRKSTVVKKQAVKRKPAAKKGRTKK